MGIGRSFFLSALAMAAVASPAWAVTRSGGSHSSGSVHSSSSARAAPSYHGSGAVTSVHGAGAVQGYNVASNGHYAGGYYAGGYYGGPRVYSYGYGYGTPYPYSRYYWGWGYRYYPWALASAPLPAAYESAPAPSLMATVGAQGQLVSGGGALGVNLLLEGQRFGFMADFNNLVTASADGSGNYDQTRLLDAHVTYALISDPHGRLRLEGGVDAAMIGSRIMAGPGVGISAGLGLLGPVGIEGAVRLTPWPYRALDAMGGLSLGLGPVGIRGGYRYTFIDDVGLVDGTQHVNGFAGPYVGLALTI